MKPSDLQFFSGMRHYGLNCLRRPVLESRRGSRTHVMGCVLPKPAPILCAVLLLLIATSSCAQTALTGNGNVFLTSRVFGTGGGGPTGMAVADFNRDGHLDVVVTNSGSSSVGVLLGKGDGTFQAPIISNAGTNADWVTVGDFNGDGIPDIAVVGPGGPTAVVNVLLGNGDGTFTLKTSVSLLGAQSVTAGDFNGDGKLDLAVVAQAQGATDAVLIYLGNGDGTFQTATPKVTSLGGLIGAREGVVGDFNKDGKLDLAVATRNEIGSTGSGKDVIVLFGNGDGTFNPLMTTTLNLTTAGWGIAVADFNNDGNLDIAATTPGDAGVSIFLGDGTGKFTPVNNPVSLTLPTASVVIPGFGTPSEVAVGDFNNDGKQDVIVAMNGASQAACVGVLLGNGDGTLGSQLLFGAAPSVTSVAVGDFNGDGKLDWVATTNNSLDSVTIALGRGDGTFQAARLFIAGNAPTFSPAFADFNGDGILDAVVTNQPDNDISILLGKGDGSFQPPVNMAFSGIPGLVVTGDFNNDGKQDFAVRDGFGNPSTVAVYLGNGDGTFQAPKSSTTGGVFGSFIVAGDFNGDGKLDLAVSNSDGASPNIAILLGNGDGTFAAPIITPTGGGSTQWLATGDFNKDGHLDLVVVDTTNGDVAIFLGKGDGTFQAPILLPRANANTATVGDFNNDGNPDLVVISAAGAFVYLGDGKGNFGTALPVSLGTPGPSGPTWVAVGDFNLDGNLDFVVGEGPLRGVNNGYQGIQLLLGNGDGTFQPVQDYLAGAGNVVWQPAVADFDRDGTPDIAIMDFQNSILVLLNQTPPPITVSPSSLSFGNQLVGTTSSALALKVNNNGTKATTVTITPSGDFAQTNNCPVSPATLAPAASCNISVTFTPSVTGVRNGAITVSDPLPASPQMVALSGTGVAPVVMLNANNLSFGNQLVGTPSGAQVVGLTNTGTGTLIFSGAGITITGSNNGDFSQTNTCGASVAAGANCSISVTFKPTGTGNRTASVTITDNASGSPQSVSLSGTGIAPVVSFGGTTSLTFSPQRVGTSSAAQNVTLTNTGNATLTFSGSGIAITGTNSGDFSQTNTCGASVAAGANCTISVTFKPTAIGTRTASLTVTDDASNSPQSVSLTGTGAAARHVVDDFDGDGKTDMAVWRPSQGIWFVIPSSNPGNFIVQQWGTSNDVLVAGDYDGDGKTDFAVWRPSTGTWFIIPSSNPSSAIIQQWGTGGDVAVPGDYDGDGKTDFAVWRPSTGTWFIIPSSNPGTPIIRQWGTSGDIPVPGDYDGDGKTDFAVWRPSTGTWFIIPSSNPGAPIIRQWGTSGDIPVPGDYDGDGKNDFAVWRPSNGVWFIIPSSNPGAPIVQQWGTNGDVPVPGDYDGDGKTDFAVWRGSSGVWFIIPSSMPGNPTATQWGAPNDEPVEKPIGH